MKIKKIYNILNELSPFVNQEEWDNSGLMIGSMTDTFDKIYIVLDLDEEILKQIPENSLIISHHPFLLFGTKNLIKDNYPNNLIYQIIKKDCKLISIHTNWDKSHLNKYFIEEILNLKLKEIKDFENKVEFEGTLKELLNLIKNKTNNKNIEFIGDLNKEIKEFSIITGSGSREKFTTDLLVSGDLTYHTAIQLKENNKMFINLGHWETENCFPDSLIKELSKFNLRLHKLEIKKPTNIYK